MPCKKEEDESQPTNVSVPRETGETKGVKSRAKACFGYALQEGRIRSQMITKDEIQELLRMFSSEDDVTSLSQALSQVLSQVCPKLDVSHYPDATAILIALCKEPQSLKELMEKTKEKNRGRIKNNVLQHLCESGLVEPTIKDVPNSPKQKYALTDNGRENLQTIS